MYKWTLLYMYYILYDNILGQIVNKHSKAETFLHIFFFRLQFLSEKSQFNSKSSETSGNYVVYTVFLMMFLLWIYPQVTPNAGKTSVYQETPITWWAPTVCPCWSTTSEESNSWSVTERERMDPSPSSSAQEEGFAPLYEVLILSTFLWWAEASFPKTSRKMSQTAQLLRSALYPISFVFSSLF